jgi:hypothetical protein
LLPLFSGFKTSTKSELYGENLWLKAIRGKWGRGTVQWSGPCVEGAGSLSEVVRMDVQEDVRSWESPDRWQG